MRFHSFVLTDPLPQLREPHALAVLRPWMDAGNVGTLILSHLESVMNAQEFGEIARPGNFFDFTRYRPMAYSKEGQTEVDIPNTTITWAKWKGGHDFLFLHLLEPHMLSDVYVNSVFQVLKNLGVKRYCFIGSMYDLVPHTRPLLVSGTASNIKLQEELEVSNVIASDYEGPTTIAYLISKAALEIGIETLALVVHLPQCFVMENDYRGKNRLMDTLSLLYGFPPAEDDAEKAREQQDQVNELSEQFTQQQPNFKIVLGQLEARYDSRVSRTGSEVRLSPEVEEFLRDLDVGQG